MFMDDGVRKGYQLTLLNFVANHFREIILKTAKSLVEDTKTLVAGAASNQEQLASAAQSAVMTITRLADSVKQGAASLGSDQPEAQVHLMHSPSPVMPRTLVYNYNVLFRHLNCGLVFWCN